MQEDLFSPPPLPQKQFHKSVKQTEKKTSMWCHKLDRLTCLLLLLLLSACSVPVSSSSSRVRQPLADDGHHGGSLFAVDLTHTLSDVSPVTEGASPLEMIRENLDELNGAR